MASNNYKYMSEEYDSEDGYVSEENRYECESSFGEDNDLAALNHDPSGEWGVVDDNSSRVSSQTSIPDSWEEEDDWETSTIKRFNLQIFKPALQTKTAQPVLSMTDEEIRMEVQRKAHVKKMEEEKKLREIRASLPTESAAGKAKRLAEEKMRATVKKPTYGSGNIFGHRRNGGGKGKKDTTVAPTAKALEQIAAAKLEKKRKKKEEKKAEEEKRAMEFAKAPVEDKPIVEMADFEEKEDDEEEDEYDLSMVMTKTVDIDYNIKSKCKMPNTTPIRKGKGKTKTFIIGSSRIAELRADRVFETKTKRMCMYVEKGKMCPHGDKCRFSHTKGDAQTVPVSERTKGFELLEDKTKLSEKLKYTKMCKSVISGKPCIHPKGQCRFAHSLDQLRIAVCGFGDECRRVSWNTSGVCRNKSKTMKCDFKHPSETEGNFYSRIGLKRVSVERNAMTRPVIKPTPLFLEEQKAKPNAWASPLKPVVVEKVSSPSLDVKPVEVKPVEVEKAKPNAWSSPLKPVVKRTKPNPWSSLWDVKPVEVENAKPNAWSSPLKPVVERAKPNPWSSRWDVKPVEVEPVEVEKVRRSSRWDVKPVEVEPVEVEETVLRVPKDMAIMAMEIALKSGKKNIRIELIE